MVNDKGKDEKVVCGKNSKKRDCGEFLEVWGNWESPDWSAVNSKGLNYGGWSDCNWENQQIEEQEKSQKKDKKDPD